VSEIVTSGDSRDDSQYVRPAAHNELRKLVVRMQWRAIFTNGYIALGALAAPCFLLMSLRDGLQHSEMTTVVVSLIGFLFYGYQIFSILHDIRQAKQFRRNTEAFAPVPDVARDIIREIVASLCGAMDIARPRIRYHLAVCDYSATPSMIENDGVLDLIIPLGFLKILKSMPQVARSMLAHEMAHFSHMDTNGWLLASAYMRFTVRTLIPLSALLVLNLFSGFTYIESIHAEAKQDVYLQQSGRALLASAGFEPGPPSTITVNNEVFTSAKRLFVLQICGSIWVAALFITGISTMRRRSEEAADLSAALYTTPESTAAAFMIAHVPFHTEAGPLSVHPSLEFRLNALRAHFPDSTIPNIDLGGENGMPLRVSKAPVRRTTPMTLARLGTGVGIAVFCILIIGWGISLLVP